jgi:hypothetical protein
VRCHARSPEASLDRPHHGSGSGAGRQRRNETDRAVRKSHRLHDLGQPQQETVNCAQDNEQNESEYKNPGIAKSGARLRGLRSVLHG